MIVMKKNLQRASIIICCLTYFCVDCRTQQSIALPTSYKFIAKNNASVCLATDVTICIGSTLLEELSNIPLPQLNFGSSQWSITGIALSKNGRYVYVAAYGTDGLYRYDKIEKVWRTITPPDAGSDVSALHVDENNVLTIGTGGYPASHESDARGLFQSLSNGEGWTKYQFKDSSARSTPGVTEIQLCDDARLAISCVQKSGTAESGIYIEGQNGVWKRLSSRTGQILASGNYLYSSNPTGSLSIIDLNNESAPPKQADAPATILAKWKGDTIAAFYDGLDDGRPARLNLLIGKSVVRVLPLPNTPDTPEKLKFGAILTEDNATQFLLLGGGKNRLLGNSAELISEVVNSRPLPSAVGIFETPNWSVAKIDGHGWFRIIDVSNWVQDSSMFRFLPFSSLDLRAENDGLLVTKQRSVVYVGALTTSEILSLEGDTTLLSAVRIDDDALLCSTHEFGLLSFDLDTKQWSQFPSDGLPVVTESGGSKRPAKARAVFLVDKEIYAWYDFGEVASIEDAGLYRFSSSWSRINSIDLPAGCELQKIRTSSNRAILTLARYENSRLAGSYVLRLQVMEPKQIVVSDSLSTIPDVTDALGNVDQSMWITSYGDVWTAKQGSLNRTKVLEGLNSVIGLLNDKGLVGTRDRGLIVLDAPSSVRENSLVNNRDPISVWPLPVQSGSILNISVEGEVNCINNIDIYNLIGERLKAPSFTLNKDESTCTVSIRTNGLVGSYFIVMQSPTGSRAIPIIVEAN